MRNAFVIALVTIGCAHGSAYYGVEVTAGFWDGRDHYFATDEKRDEWLAHDVDVLRDQAARDLACAASSLLITHPYERAYVVSGCGRQAPFLLVRVGSEGRVWLPDRNHPVYVSWVRAVNLASEGSMVPLPRVASSLLLPNPRPWITLVAQGAKDLECPLSQVTPDFVPQGKAPDLPVAEGCGKRATYLSEPHPDTFRLSSIVPIR